jgi:hypothetical protein
LFAELGFDQSEDQQSDPDDAGQRVDAVVVVQKDRPDFEGLLVVAVATLDDLLAFVFAGIVRAMRGCSRLSRAGL